MLRSTCLPTMLMLLVGCGLPATEETDLPELGQAQQGLLCAAPCPGNVTSYRGQNGYQFKCYCSPEATLGGAVWGTSIYTDDSTLCMAARHAGSVSASGGDIFATVWPGQSSYLGSTQNGITSYSYSAWVGSVKTASSAACTVPCPSGLSGYRGQNGLTITCSCSAAAAGAGSVYGTGYYTDDSSLCRAAVHAGAITLNGGTVRATVRPGQVTYTGSTKNGVTSYSYWSWPGSYEVICP
jgi:hypothetical protein